MNQPAITMLSHWEVKTHGQAALRVLGLPFGTTERAAELFAWAHAVQTGVVEFLVEESEEIAANAAQRITVSANKDGEAHLDGHHQSIFALGPAIVDLACALATTSGTSSVVIDNVHGTRFAAELAWRAAQRGFTTTVVAADSAWFASPSGGPKAYNDRSDSLTVTCSREPAPSDTTTQKLEVPEALATAQREGYPTASKSAEQFLALGRQLWLPTSKRSRAQGSEGDKT